MGARIVLTGPSQDALHVGYLKRGGDRCSGWDVPDLLICFV